MSKFLERRHLSFSRHRLVCRYTFHPRRGVLVFRRRLKVSLPVIAASTSSGASASGQCALAGSWRACWAHARLTLPQWTDSRSISQASRSQVSASSTVSLARISPSPTSTPTTVVSRCPYLLARFSQPIPSASKVHEDSDNVSENCRYASQSRFTLLAGGYRTKLVGAQLQRELQLVRSKRMQR